MNTLKNLIERAVENLKQIYTKREAQNIIFILIENLFDISKFDYYSKKDKIIEQHEVLNFDQKLKELLTSKPIQYVTQKTFFYELELFVNEHVLIPRPETEQLVDMVVKKYENTSPKILDIGTGSGSIAIAVKKYIKNAKVTACDISETALKVAKENAKKNQVEISFKRADILNHNDWNFFDKFDVIISNPPYLTNKQKKTMHKNVLEYEPHQALFVDDKKPLIFYDFIMYFAMQKMVKNKSEIFLEINPEFANSIKTQFMINGFENTKIIKDFSQKDRFFWAKYA